MTGQPSINIGGRIAWRFVPTKDKPLRGAPITRAETEKQNLSKESSYHWLSQQEFGGEDREAIAT